MLRSEADKHVREWPVNEFRVYYYRGGNPWVKEIVVLARRYPTSDQDDREFRCDRDSSTTMLENMSAEELLRMLSNRELIFKEEFNPWTNYKKEKTGGCTCGAWAVSWYGDHHDPKLCDLAKFRR